MFAGVATRVLRVKGEGPPMLLLHGYSDSADTWRPLMDLLPKATAAVAVDLPPSELLNQHRFVKVIAALAAELGRVFQAEKALLGRRRKDRAREPMRSHSSMCGISSRSTNRRSDARGSSCSSSNGEMAREARSCPGRAVRVIVRDATPSGTISF